MRERQNKRDRDRKRDRMRERETQKQRKNERERESNKETGTEAASKRGVMSTVRKPDHASLIGELIGWRGAL